MLAGMRSSTSRLRRYSVHIPVMQHSKPIPELRLPHSDRSEIDCWAVSGAACAHRELRAKYHKERPNSGTRKGIDCARRNGPPAILHVSHEAWLTLTPSGAESETGRDIESCA